MSSAHDSNPTCRKGTDLSSNKTPWITARYAPCKFNPNAYSADKAKTRKRQAVISKTADEKDNLTANMMNLAIERDKVYESDRNLKRRQNAFIKQQAAKARAEYAARQLKRSEKLKLTSIFLDSNLNNRVYAYAKHHTCPHGYANNRVARNTGGYRFYCDCEDSFRDKIWDNQSVKCDACGTSTSDEWINLKCLCKHTKCPRCKRCQYEYFHDGRNLNLWYDKHNLEQTEVYLTIDGVSTFTPCIDAPARANPENTPLLDVKYKAKSSRKQFLDEMKTLTNQVAIPQIEHTDSSTISSYHNPVKYADALFKKDAPKNESPKKDFLAKLKPKKRSILFAPVDKHIPQFEKLGEAKPSNLPFETTVPEGGAMSHAIDPFLSAGTAIKAKFAEFRDNALHRLRELRDKLIFDAMSSALKKTLEAMLGTLTYFVKVCYDYLAVLNPILLYRLWDSRARPVQFGLFVAEAFYNLSQFEDHSRESMYLFLSVYGPHQFLREFRDQEFGVLTSLMGHHVNKFRHSKMDADKLRDTLTDIIKRLGVTGASSCVKEKLRRRRHRGTTDPTTQVTKFDDDWEVDEEHRTIASSIHTLKPKKTMYNKLSTTFKKLITKAEGSSSTDSILECVTSIISTFPKSFGRGIRFLNDMFKQNMPLLMGIRSLAALTDIGKRVADSIMHTLYGKCSSPKEWIEYQITQEGNPIHQIVTTYMVYLASVSNRATVETLETTATSLRARFYNELHTAEVYVRAQKKFGMPWISFKNALSKAFDTPPSASAREFEPVCLVLSGESGVGKSTIWPVLMASEFPATEGCNPLRCIQDITYNWNVSSEYQPGISNKKIILFDDFMQNIGEVTEALNIIALCTTAPYPINSANITGPEIKGMFADPAAIVLCTNTTPGRAAANLASPEALARRYDLEFRVEKRFNPEIPEEEIMTIVTCPQYKSIVGSTVSLRVARAIYSTVFRAKRDRFKQTRTLVSDLMSQPITCDLTFGATEFSAYKNKKQWQENCDFEKDFFKYQDAKPEPPPSPSTSYGTNSPKRQQSQLIFTREFSSSEAEDFDEETTTTEKPRAEDFTISTLPETSVPQDLLQVSMSTLLTGAYFGVTAATAYSFSAFMISLGRDWQEAFGGGFGRHGLGPSSIFTYLKKIFTSFVSCAITSVSAGLAAFAIYKMASSSAESGTSRTAKTGQRVVTFEQSGIPDGLQTLFDQATGSARVCGTNKLTNCLFIGGHYVLLPYHLLTDYQGRLIGEGEKIELKKVTWQDNMKPVEFFRKNLIMLTGNVDAVMTSAGGLVGNSIREDVCLYQLPAAVFSAEKNIIKHFWDGNYSLTNMPVRKIDYIPYTSEGEHRGQLVYNDGKVTRDCIQTIRFEGHDQRVHILAEANYANRDSSCGSMILRTDTQEKSILGIHTATRNGKSYFHFVTRSSLEKAIEGKVVLDVETGYTLSHPEATVLDILPVNSVITPVGHIDKPLFQPTKTDLQPSLLHGLMGPVTTAPAPLSHRDPRIDDQYKSHSSFWRQMFKGYSRPAEPSFSIEEVEHATKSLMEDFDVVKSKSIVPTKLLTLHECINGLPNIPENTRMPMNTSCGYPYVQEGLKKTDLFEDVDGVLVPSARIVKDFDHAVACLQKGTVPFLPYILSLKDERLNYTKIKEPRTRIFTCGSVIGYLICRRYFYSALMQYYHADIHDSFCFPSLDRSSFDWHFLCKKMTEVGFSGFDFDFRFWDRTLRHLILYYSGKFLLHRQIMEAKEEAAVLEMVSSPVMIWGAIVFLGSFLPSGILITFLLNCVANELMHRMAWVAILRVEKPLFVEMRHYKMYTRPSRGGDDTFSTVEARMLEYFNGRTVGEYLVSRGMQVTSASKSLVIPEYSDFCDLSFLKNTTRYERGVFLPITELQSLYESTYWVRLSTQNNDIVKATQDNAICAMRPLFFHGEETFNEFRNKALSKVPQLVLPTYHELSIIWNQYHQFPGSHTDFASREIQEDPFTRASKLLPIAADGGSNFTMYSNIQTIDTHTQSGLSMTALDKEQLGSAAIQSAPTQNEDISAISDEIIDNQASGLTSKTSKEITGTSIQDAPGTKSKPVKTGDQVVQSKNHRAEVYLNDINWDLERLLSKFTLVRTVPWTTADAEDTMLLSLETPLDFLVTPAQKKPFDLTKFWKGTVLVKVVVKASPFYAGSIAVGFSPIQTPPNIYRIINMGGLVHKLSQEEGIEFTIPFRWHQGYIDVARDSLGKFCIFVVSPLRTGPDNANSIDLSIYASLIDSEFKLPDTIPPASYTSHKFPAVSTLPQSSIMTLDTIPESNANVATVTCDINMIPSKMPTTVMCAGTGVTGSNEIPHFQDSASCLVQLGKRFGLLSTVDYILPANTVLTADFFLNEIFRSVMHGTNQSFAMFRGSVNLRFFMESRDGNRDRSHGVLSLTAFDIQSMGLPVYQNPFNAGYQTFDESEMGMITIPWIQPNFVAFTDAAKITARSDITGFLRMSLINDSLVQQTVRIRIDGALADDFHYGCYIGGPGAAMYTPYILLPTRINVEAVEVDQSFPQLLETQPQSGMLQFVQRAIETALPIVETVSALGLELDAHMITDQSQLVQPRKRPFSANTDLGVLTERLLTVNHNGMTLPDTSCFGTSSTETGIYDLLQDTKSLVSRFEWNLADEVGKPLADFWAGPDGHSSYAPGDIHARIPEMFCYYTGGTRLIFDIQATEMHRGQLLLSYRPVFFNDETPVNYVEATQTYFATIDLSVGRATLAVDLPYLSPRPQTPCVKQGEVRNAENSHGVLTVFVQNPLRATSTVGSSVQVVVYKSFMPDFQLGIYAGREIWTRPSTELTIPRNLPVLRPASPSVPSFKRKPLIRSILPPVLPR